MNESLTAKDIHSKVGRILVLYGYMEIPNHDDLPSLEVCIKEPVFMPVVRGRDFMVVSIAVADKITILNRIATILEEGTALLSEALDRGLLEDYDTVVGFRFSPKLTEIVTDKCVNLFT